MLTSELPEPQIPKPEQDTASQMNSPAIEKGIWPKFRLQCQRPWVLI